MSDPDDRHHQHSRSVQPPPGPKPGLRARFDAAIEDQARRPEGAGLLPDRLCRAALKVLEVDAAAISVFLIGEVCFPVAASDPDAALAEDLQFSLGEGPCLPPFDGLGPVFLPDLDDARSPAVSPWPMYAAEMSRRTPYRAMIAFPLRVWDPVVGWLTLYQRAGSVPIDVGSGTVIAARITDLLLGAGRLTEHRVERGRRWLEGPAARRRAQVRRAQGITMQLNRIGSSDALAVLRARAYGAGELLDDLAEDIVAGRVPVPTLGWDP